MSKSNTYDAFGRLWKENEMVDGKTLEQEYLYDQGKLSSVTYRANTGSNSLTFPVVCKYNTNGYLYRLEDENENMLREVNSINAFGQETSVGFGNGLTTQSAYTSFGSLTNINTSKIGTSNTIQNMGYDFNPINGTLNSRTDIKNDNLTESFNYGALYRLEGYGTTVNRQSVGYKPNGNIETKTDVGGYTYDLNGKPFTLSGINTSDNSGQKTQLDINYTVMSRPTTISKGTYTAYIDYNDAYERVFEEFKQGTNVLSTKHLMAGGQYEVETKAGVETQRLYVDGSPYSASVIIEKVGSAAAQPFYLHSDYLGSITQVSDKFGNLAAEYSYDAWGRMRNVTNWQLYAAGTEPELLFGRGYTGHEHLNKFGLINMNARLYDPVLGRFLAPDPLVASPDESNGYNRYMYASNNPLMYVDISGEYTDYPNDDSGSTNIIQEGRGISSTGVYTSENFNFKLPPGSNLYGNSSTIGGNNYSSAAGGNNYNSGFGGIGGNNNIFSGNLGGGYSYGVSVESSFVFGLANWLLGPHHPRAYYSGLVKSTPSQYSTYTLKTVLKNVSGSGVSTAYAGGGKRQGSKGWEFYTGLAATGNTAISTFGYYKQFTQFSKVLEIWKGNNGIIYQGLKGRGPNGFTGPRAFAATKSTRIGVGTNALTVLGLGITSLNHIYEMRTNPGPNLKRYYEKRYIRDQAFNASGFFTIWGAAASTGYNLGYLIEFLTGKNIQLNPYTLDFTPIEQTLTEFDNLGLYHVYK